MALSSAQATCAAEQSSPGPSAGVGTGGAKPTAGPGMASAAQALPGRHPQCTCPRRWSKRLSRSDSLEAAPLPDGCCHSSSLPRGTGSQAFKYPEHVAHGSRCQCQGYTSWHTAVGTVVSRDLPACLSPRTHCPVPGSVPRPAGTRYSELSAGLRSSSACDCVPRASTGPAGGEGREGASWGEEWVLPHMVSLGLSPRRRPPQPHTPRTAGRKAIERL